MITKLPNLIIVDEKIYELLLVYTNSGTAEKPHYQWCCSYVNMQDNDPDRLKPRTINTYLKLSGVKQDSLKELEDIILDQIKNYERC